MWGGGESTWLRGNPGSPGMAKLLSRAMFWTSFWASLFVCSCQRLLQIQTPKSANKVREEVRVRASSHSSCHSIHMTWQTMRSSAMCSPHHLTLPTPNSIHVPCIHTRPNLRQTLAHPKNAINQQPIRRPLDLKVAKERIRPE